MKDPSLKNHKALLKTIKCVRNYLNRSKLFQSSQEKQNPDFFYFCKRDRDKAKISKGNKNHFEI